MTKVEELQQLSRQGYYLSRQTGTNNGNMEIIPSATTDNSNQCWLIKLIIKTK